MELQNKKEKLVSLGMLSFGLLILLILCIVFRESLSEKLQNNFLKGKNYLELLEGLGNTLLITIVAFVLGLFLGAGLCII